MATYLAYGELKHNSQGPNTIQELVKHFESAIDWEDLQDQINVWLLLIGTDAILLRPSVRTISFQILEKPLNPDKGILLYFAQVHYLLTGDDGQPV
jgi:hypothetical protein